MSDLLRILYEVKQNSDKLVEVIMECFRIINQKGDEIFTEEGLIFLKGIAKISFEKGYYEVAEEFYDMAMDVCRLLKGEDSIDCAVIYNDAALVQEKKGNIKSAEVLYRRCLRILTAKYGKNHPFTKTVYENLKTLKGKRQGL